ncbi:MAG TPA: glycosyltransferase [Candidatus Sulfotelmatobacter sp.]|jgi:glycosyltransferase involved in cell wall biosynthesis|nr:glycosyltransferase [Candidatus Sulfotelmatobacter sp.]
MKIAFITTGTINSSISSRALALAKELYKRGNEVSIVSPRFDKYSKFIDEGITQIEGIEIIRPLQIRKVPFEIGLIPYIFSSIKILYHLNPDVIHIFKPTPITISGIFFKYIKKIPVIVDADDLDSEVMRIEGHNSIMIILVTISEIILFYQSSAITVASQYLSKFYKKKYKNRIIKYMPNGADFTLSDVIQTDTLSKNRVIFVGNLNRINILEPLLYAIKNIKLQKIFINVIVIGDGQYLNYFKKLSKKLFISKDIKFFGFIPQNKLYKYVKVGDIGYCYMPNEITAQACSNMKVFQYMQLGATPLVSNVGDLPNYIFNGKAGYIAKHSNIKSLTDTICLAMSEIKKRKEKIEFSLEHGKKQYSWPVLGKELELLYKKLV